MSIFTSIFGNNKSEPNLSDESDRVSCEDIADLIRERANNFREGRGMILVLLEVKKVKIYSFNGVSKISWNYTNHQLSIDRVGETVMDGSPLELILKINEEPRLAQVIKEQFHHCDIGTQPLWHLDPSAPDYRMMEISHRDDVGIRISYE